MLTFELNVFIDCPRGEVYDHISNPINMIGLQPNLTTIDVLKEQKDEKGIILRPFHTVQTFRWAGLPIYRNRLYSVIHLTKPKEELEFHVHGKPNIYIIFNYALTQDNDKRTHIKQTVDFVQVNKILEGFVAKQANQSQRAVLSNLKVRLEANSLH
ncbi:MAG TPA: SRPBCC family protein [Anaerolineales bacterium]|nr:SRPBCC family protein [Anaerolineales bacterium]